MEKDDLLKNFMVLMLISAGVMDQLGRYCGPNTKHLPYTNGMRNMKC